MAGRYWRWLVRSGFRLLYNEMAWTYDIVSWTVSLGEWRKWQMAAMPFVMGTQILEIAHGPGHMLLALAQCGYRVTGLDMSTYMGRMAARRLRRAGQAPALVRGKAQMLPFRAQSFDTVLTTFPTYFIAEWQTMRAVYEVLRPGGCYIIVPEGHLTGKGLVQRFIGWLYQITGQREEVFATGEDDSWSAETPQGRVFRRAMSEIGFVVEVQRIRLARSEATVIIGRRPAPSHESNSPAR